MQIVVLILFLLILQRTSAGILGSILGNILSGENSKPDLEYGAYYKGPVCTPNEPIRRPTTTQEVVKIVKEAIRKGTTCKAFGKRHSVTDIICTNGIPIDMTGFHGMTMNPDHTVTVGAGVNVHDLGDFLLAHGRALKTMPAFGNITVGGAIGTGAHGSTLKYTASISEQAIGFVIVDGQAQVRDISNEEDLNAFRVHLGLLGIIVQVRLRTHPLYKIRGHNYVVDDALLFNQRAIDLAYRTDQIAYYWFPAYSKVVVVNSTIVDASKPGEAISNDIVPSTSATLNFYGSQALEAIQAAGSMSALNIIQAFSMRTLYTKVPDYVPIYTQDGNSVVNPAVGYPHHMLAAICINTGWYQCPWLNRPEDQHEVDNEIALDLHDLPKIVETVKDILQKYPAVFPIQGIRLRFSAPSSTLMSFNYERPTVHFEFFISARYNPYENPSTGLAAYQAILQALVFKYAGRPHWGKTGLYYHSREVIEHKLDYGAHQAFLGKMWEYDPYEVFMNDFGRRLKGTGDKINLDPSTTHCALLDNCICSHHSDCAQNQICSTIEGYPDYPVCKDIESKFEILDDNPNLPTTSISDYFISILGLASKRVQK